MTHAIEFAPGLVIQGIDAPQSLAAYKLIAFDMDSTLINIECVDEIADAAGRKAQVAAITEAAMQGVITDYKESLRQRVALLKGVTVQHMEQVFTERLRFNPGAQALVAAAKAAGLTTLLVSGGFTFFANRVRAGLASTSPDPICWRSSTNASQDAWSIKTGATFVMVRKNAARCWKSRR